MKMDDLDHSMLIAEYDWTSFYEESEQCSFLQPSLACLDNLSLTDSEDSDYPSPVFSTGQQDIWQSPEKTTDNITNTFHTQVSHVQCSGVSEELTKEDGDLQKESDNSRNESDPLFLHQTQLNMNEPHPTKEAGSKDVSNVASRAEKERWFVTVNDRPARQRGPVSSEKKKQRQKKFYRNMCTSRQKESVENGSEINKDKNECEGGRDMRGFTQSNPKLIRNSRGRLSAGKNPECTSDSPQMPCEEDTVLEKWIKSHSLKKHITTLTMDRHTCGRASLPSVSHNTFTPKVPLQVESPESDESEDGVEFFSVHSCDSESYLSAAESVDETPRSLTENQKLSLTTHHLQNTEATKDIEIHPCDRTLCCNASATNCDGCESTSVESTLEFPSAGQKANKTPDDNSTCDNDKHNTGLCRPSDTPTLQKQEINLLASGGSSGRKLSPQPVPELTVAPCSVADSPETYVRAAGHRRSVYAISGFWDEMEKLTINDILQVRMSRGTPPRGTQEAVTPNADDSPQNHSFVVDAEQYNLSAGGLMDTSDTADSDYFTQPDESKPDCSSCEFSTSDFEEEYWQFIGTSRNPSPDPQGKNQQKTSDFPFLSQEEPSSMCSEGKATPVSLEDFEGQSLEESHAWRKLSWPRQITKSTTMHNVQAFSTEDLTLQSLFGNDERNPFLSRCHWDENMGLKLNDNLETLIPTPVLSSTAILEDHYQISIPEVFEYFFTEDKGNNDPRFVTIYDPEGISVASMFDCTLCSFRDEISFSSLHDLQRSEEKPIPIFSCSHPTVTELTFPKPDYVFLNADCEEEDTSPIRVVSRVFTQATDSELFQLGQSLRKIHFHDKGSVWCQRSGAWVFPAEPEKTTMKRKDPPVAVLTEGTVSFAPTQLLRELALQQRIWEIIHTRQEQIFSTLRQSDMCLVCIALSSWVLRSSDPEAADTWKAALLANVSALSAIQFLRRYVKKKNPQDDP